MRQDEDEMLNGILKSIVEKYDEQPDQCTIYPAGIDKRERCSAWITAQEGSFIDTQTIR